MFARRSSLRLAALVLFGLLAPSARAGDDLIELKIEDLGLTATETESLDRRKAREVLKEARKAFATIANELGTNSGEIFARRSDRPRWVPWSERQEPRLWIRLEEGVNTGRMGAGPYLERMERSEFRIYLPAPAEKDLSPDEVHRIWREVAYAIQAHTTWVAAPHWLREGVAEYYGCLAAEGGHSLLPVLREQLADGVDDLLVPEILVETDREAWGRAGGRAVSWALVTLLMEADDRIVPGLHGQIRMLLDHLVHHGGSAEVTREFTALVNGQLEELGLSSDVLQTALFSWVGEEFPEGSDFRRSETKRVVRVRKRLRPFGVSLSGRFGSRTHITDDLGVLHTYQPFKGGQLAWRFPWPSRMDLYVGVCGRPGTNYGLRPDAQKDGVFLRYEPRSVPEEGRDRIRARTLDLTKQTTAFGFIWCAITSPEGLGYLYREVHDLK